MALLLFLLLIVGGLYGAHRMGVAPFGVCLFCRLKRVFAHYG